VSAALPENWRIVRDDLSHPAVVALIAQHVREAYANSPPGGAFVLDTSALRVPAVTLWSLWDGAALLGMGALKQLDAAHGEVKSMRTAPGQQRRGVAAAMLGHLIAEARARGYARLSLETGSNAPFAAARALYARAGFTDCEPFADYTDRDFSRYYTLAL
jgi:putative acetyltransferase